MDMLTDQLDSVADELIALLVSLVEFALVLIVAGAIAKLARRLGLRWSDRRKLDPRGRLLIMNGLTIGVYLVAFTALLVLWGMTWNGLVAAFGVGTIIAVLGFQSILQSIVGGIFIVFERPFSVGDRIAVTTQGVEGVVEEIRLRTTVIRTSDGERMLTPNSIIFNNSVINRSTGGGDIRPGDQAEFGVEPRGKTTTASDL